MTSEDRIDQDGWENRQLCSDGNCIGVIGPDGRCKECGKPGGSVAAGTDDAASEDPHREAPVEQDAEADAPTDDDLPAAADSTPDEDDWAQRRLCPDGNCIGVIGPDGRCKECGKAAE